MLLHRVCQLSIWGKLSHLPHHIFTEAKIMCRRIWWSILIKKSELEKAPVVPKGYQILTRQLVTIAVNKDGEQIFWIPAGETKEGTYCKEGFWSTPKGENLSGIQRSRYLKWWEE